jgi:hypothetical protein
MLNETTETTEVTPLSEFFVGREVVNHRVKRFQNGKHQLLTNDLVNRRGSGTETRFVWYPKRYFEMIMEEMERYDANGLRIYFGEYEDDGIHPAAGQLGLLLVLTKMNASGNVTDLLFEEQADFTSRASVPRNREVILMPGDDSGLPREFNVCAPCPPICINQEPNFPENDVS